MKKLFILLFLFCCALYVNAQQHVAIHFEPSFMQQTLVLEKEYVVNDSTTFSFSSVRFYVSNVQLLQNNKVVFTEKKSVHFIDASIEKSWSFFLNAKKNIVFNAIRFDIGIDSATNVSGALGGDLDPTKGMYWTWQNGYINFKVEGKTNLSSARNHEFEFHIGGYQTPFNAIQKITLDVINTNSISIKIDVDKFVHSIDFKKQNHIMSPCVEAVEMAKQFASCFYIPK